MDAKTEQKTVLIVEDEKNIVDILRFNLQREGYRTVEAYDGADGLDSPEGKPGHHPAGRDAAENDRL